MDDKMKPRVVNKSTEELRQLWGAQQRPELITTVQAHTIFDRSFQNFSQFAKDNGLTPIVIEEWSRAIFYNKAEVEIFAKRYIKENPSVKKKYIQAQPIQASLSSFSALQAGNWTAVQFLNICGTTEREEARNVINGSSSILLLSGEDAASLIYLLIYNYPRKTVFRMRFDLIEYYEAAEKYKKRLAGRYDNLIDIIRNYHEHTDFGYLDPEISVAVLAELMLSNPSKK
jgi:hypothetical protein